MRNDWNGTKCRSCLLHEQIALVKDRFRVGTEFIARLRGDKWRPVQGVGRRWAVLKGDGDADIARSDFVQRFCDGITSQFRPVTIAAEMAEKNMFQIGRDNLLGCRGSRVVREVPVAA